jgi:hypothetical protein
MCNVSNGGTYLPYGKNFMIEMDIRTLQQKQGTIVSGFCAIDSMFHFLNKNTYEKHKIEVTY